MHKPGRKSRLFAFGEGGSCVCITDLKELLRAAEAAKSFATRDDRSRVGIDSRF
jgi:hypothetical protein